MIPKSGAFPLQKVLEYRKHLEDMRAIELGKTQAKHLKADKQLKKLRVHKEEMLEESSKEMDQSPKVDLTQLKIEKGYLENLNGQIINQTDKVHILKEEVEKDREELKGAMKERKMVEKLKDHFTERKKTEANRRENQKIDEVAIRLKTIPGNQGA